MRRAFHSNFSLGSSIFVTPLIFRFLFRVNLMSSLIFHKEPFEAKATQTLKFYTLVNFLANFD